MKYAGLLISAGFFGFLGSLIVGTVFKVIAEGMTGTQQSAIGVLGSIIGFSLGVSLTIWWGWKSIMAAREAENRPVERTEKPPPSSKSY